MERVPSVTIEHWRNVYSVPPDHPLPEELCSRLDRMVEREVAEACQRWLAPLLDQPDDSYWLIKEVQIDLSVDIERVVAQQAGTVWGEQLGMEIQRVLEGGARGDCVIRFDDSTAYIAQWARDMAAGCAWEKWYYADFHSLRSLPQSAAIAEGIIREPDQAKRIVHLLHEQRALNAVLDSLTSADAKRFYEAAIWGSSLPFQAGDPGRWTARLLALWNGITLSGDGNLWRDALRLYATAFAEWPDHCESDASGLRVAISGVLQLRRALAHIHSPQMTAHFLQAAAAERRDVAEEILAACGASAEFSVIDFVRCASSGDPEWAGFAAEVIGSAQTNGNSNEAFVSELGGIFLLGSAWRNLHIAEAVRIASKSCEEPERAEASLRLLLAARCMGRARASLAAGDAAVTLFAGADSKMPLHELAETLTMADAGAALRLVEDRILESGGSPDDPWVEEHIDYFGVANIFPELQVDTDRDSSWSRIAAAVLRNFARRLPRFAHSSPEYLFHNFLAGTCFVRSATGRIEVRLPQSPLAVVLHIAGAYGTLSLPWKEGVEICLLTPTD
jgi:hypothetical protein